MNGKYGKHSSVINSATNASAIILVIFVSAIGIFFNTYVLSNNTYATSSTLELTISDSKVNVDIGTLSSTGTFKKSAVTTVSAKTNNATGYTLSIAATSTDTNPSALKNTEDSSIVLNSIEEAVDEDDFSALTPASNITNKWGYYFIRHGQVAANTTHTFSPAPTASGTEIEKTNVANPTTANEYDLAIGARIDSTVRIGSYANTYIVQLVGNAIPYTIIYNDSTVSNMPVDVSTVSATEAINISSVTPTRDGYTFAGWCSIPPRNNAGNDTCTGGTTYSAGQQVNLDQTSSTNNYNLYAMWTLNTPVNDNIYMQNVASWAGNLRIGQEVTAVDIRDGKTYTVARLCMNTSGCTAGDEDTNNTNSRLWMTQNLDLVLGPTGVATLTSNDSDINNDLGTTMGYTTSNGVITWTPSGGSMGTPATITGTLVGGNNASMISGWTNTQVYPHQAEGGNRYVYTSGDSNTDNLWGSRWDCIVAGHTDAECSHYHIGNYYNWSASVASNDTTAYSDGADGMPYLVAPNSICPKGWRLPKGLTGSDQNNDNQITEFNRLAIAYGITTGRTVTLSPNTTTGLWENVGWATNGFNNFRTSPLYFVRSGIVDGAALYYYGTAGYLWSSTARSGSIGYYLTFYSGELHPAGQNNRYYGFPVRCVAR